MGKSKTISLAMDKILGIIKAGEFLSQVRDDDGGTGEPLKTSGMILAGIQNVSGLPTQPTGHPKDTTITMFGAYDKGGPFLPLNNTDGDLYSFQAKTGTQTSLSTLDFKGVIFLELGTDEAFAEDYIFNLILRIS